MKRTFIVGAALALMCGVASAQTHPGASSNPNTTKKNAPHKMERHHTTTGGSARSGTVGSSGMDRRNPTKAQPGGLAGSGGSNAGNAGGAAPGGSAGGGAGK